MDADPGDGGRIDRAAASLARPDEGIASIDGPSINEIRSSSDLRNCWFFGLLLTIAALAVWDRTAGLPPDRYRLLLDNDSWRFYHQSRLLTQAGALLPRDIARWVPLGRDMTRQLLLWPWVLRIAARLVQALFPPVSSVSVAIFSGPVVFAAVLLVYGLLVERLLLPSST